MRLPTGPDETPTPVFNPDIKDYTFYYSHENEKKTTYIIPAYRITTLPFYLAKLFAGQMADQILQKRGIRDNYQLDKERVLEEILVTL